MIKNWLVTGDCHGEFTRFMNLDRAQYKPEETGIIILGDVGLNFYLNKTDEKKKRNLQNLGYTFFCVRGNHEERPENLGMSLRYVVNADYMGDFYWEDQYPNILYFANYGYYTLGNYTVYVIGGAYSVDKYYRIANYTDSRGWCGWFADEQLNSHERMLCLSQIDHTPPVDFVFTHSCPIEWEPRDLFLSAIDQSSIDKTTELFLSEAENELSYKVWLFGHYHADRLERPHVQQMFKYIESLDDIMNRWYGQPPTVEEEYWLTKSPYYYSN